FIKISVKVSGKWWNKPGNIRPNRVNLSHAPFTAGPIRAGFRRAPASVGCCAEHAQREYPGLSRLQYFQIYHRKKAWNQAQVPHPAVPIRKPPGLACVCQSDANSRFSQSI